MLLRYISIRKSREAVASFTSVRMRAWYKSQEPFFLMSLTMLALALW